MDRWCPPPVNASNLNDISNALQAVNITQQERTTLGEEATDTLGQILASLKNMTESIGQDVEEIQQTMGNVKCVYGSYVGNGQTTLTITLGFKPRYIYMLSELPQTDGNNNYIYLVWIYNNRYAYCFGSGFSGKTISVLNNGFSLSSEPNVGGSILNENAKKVYYIAFE